VQGAKRWLVVVSVLALGLAGCGGQSEVERGEHTIYVHRGSLLPRGGEDALIEGTLVTRDGCVLIDQGGGFDIAFPVIWPSGTSIASEDPLTLRLRSGDELVVGQVVSGGGGYHDAASDRVQVAIPAACVPETGEVAIFNPGADLTIDPG
jgi:hypothetical protein